MIYTNDYQKTFSNYTNNILVIWLMATQVIKSIVPIWQAIEDYKDKVGINYSNNVPLSSGFSYYIVNPQSLRPKITISHKDLSTDNNSIRLGTELPSQILLEAIIIDYNLFRRHFSSLEEFDGESLELEE